MRRIIRRLRRVLRDRRGFGPHTHIELMMPIAIIGILAAIAIPRFADLIKKSNEGATKGNLGALRSALSVFYLDGRGIYPHDPRSLVITKTYLRSLPKAKTPTYHADSAAFKLASDVSEIDDAGGWLYVTDPASEDWGTIVVNCTHTDTKEKVWTEY